MNKSEDSFTDTDSGQHDKEIGDKTLDAPQKDLRSINGDTPQS